ncbi:MAG: carbohydrate-binding family 9-like protein [Tannerella sp.]|jgi:hypothetical protein|nr:carbohydrate-binding family 9-like protein [Tannerella sp.]
MKRIIYHKNGCSPLRSLLRQASLLLMTGVAMLPLACKEKESFFEMRGEVVYAKLGIRDIPAFAAGIISHCVEHYGYGMIFLKEYGMGLYDAPDDDANNHADAKPQRKKCRLGKRIDDGQIRVDGTPDEAAWGNAVCISPFCNPWSEICPRTSLSMLHDSRNVYFLYEVEDTDMVFLPEIESELDLAKEDRVELFFSKDSLMKEYYCFEIDPQGRTLTYSCSYYRKYDYGWDAPAGYVAAASHVVPGQLNRGYTVEIAVPKAFLSGLMQDHELYFGAYRAEFSDNNGTIVQNWQTWQTPPTAEPDFHVPESLGKLCLSDSSAIRPSA